MRKLYKLLRLHACMDCKPFLFIAANRTQKNYLQYYLFLLLRFTPSAMTKNPPQNPCCKNEYVRKTQNGAFMYVCLTGLFFPCCRCCYLVLNRHSNQIDDSIKVFYTSVQRNHTTDDCNARKKRGTNRTHFPENFQN